MNLTSHHAVPGISIVCVFNDHDVRTECLDSSIKAYKGEVEVDYVSIDNVAHAFSSAGAALNHGARLARHDVVVFAHQDVYLHSIDRLAQVASMLSPTSWQVLGANGVQADGENVGRIQDRTQLIGRSAPTPVEVDSLDEVLFMARRDLLLEQPLSESADLAWHAYAVEYALRLRRMGRRVGAVDMAVTHNSLTINLARLDVAHRAVGVAYPQFAPIHTTCGTIGEPARRLRDVEIVRRHGWRLRWLRHSLLALKVRRQLDLPIVLSDIRHDVDLLPYSDEQPLYLVNVDREGGFAESAPGPLRLTRYGRPVIMRSVGRAADVAPLLDELPDQSYALVIGLALDELGSFGTHCRRDAGWIAGIHPDTLWLLRTPGSGALPSKWLEPGSIPLGSRAVA